MDGGFPKYLRDGLLRDVPAYIVMPQLTAGRWSDRVDTVYALVSELATQFQIDPASISLTGHSLGGSGAWELAAAFPGFFSRVAPLSGAVFPTEEKPCGAVPDRGMGFCWLGGHYHRTRSTAWSLPSSWR